MGEKIEGNEKNEWKNIGEKIIGNFKKRWK